MRRKRLGRSGLIVSEIGLGTMNFGSQLSEAESHRILDAALDLGINFVDTAELYSSPASPETYGFSEIIVGRWLTAGARDRVILATKVVGPADGMYRTGGHVRSGLATLDAFHIGRAVDQSLQRLGTDHIDLIQFHWPDRTVPWEEQLKAIDRLQSQGKVRYFGCSNESPWGIMRAIFASEKNGLPRPVSAQNVLNLLQADDYRALEETCVNEQIAYIGYSPLAMGLLSGKYKGDAAPAGSRFALYDRYRKMYLNEKNLSMVNDFKATARRLGMSIAELAYCWCLTRPAASVVLTSVSSVEQLQLGRRASELAMKNPVLDLNL